VDIPELMKPVGSERAAVVEVVVSAAGAVESATIRQGGGSVFDDQILRSVMLWRFRPATRNGAPVRYRMLVRVIIPPRGAAVR
jgi:protein TonB